MESGTVADINRLRRGMLRIKGGVKSVSVSGQIQECNREKKGLWSLSENGFLNDLGLLGMLVHL